MDGSCSWRLFSTCPHSPLARFDQGEKAEVASHRSNARANRGATELPVRHGGVFRMIRCSLARGCIGGSSFVWFRGHSWLHPRGASPERLRQYVSLNGPRRASATAPETSIRVDPRASVVEPSQSDAGARSFVCLGVPSWLVGLFRVFRELRGPPRGAIREHFRRYDHRPRPESPVPGYVGNASFASIRVHPWF